MHAPRCTTQQREAHSTASLRCSSGSGPGAQHFTCSWSHNPRVVGGASACTDPHSTTLSLFDGDPVCQRERVSWGWPWWSRQSRPGARRWASRRRGGRRGAAGNGAAAGRVSCTRRRCGLACSAATPTKARARCARDAPAPPSTRTPSADTHRPAPARAEWSARRREVGKLLGSTTRSPITHPYSGFGPSCFCVVNQSGRRRGRRGR